MNKIQVFLNLEKLQGDILIERFKNDIENITKRDNEIEKLNISYAVKSVILFHEAKTLYSLGMFDMTIIVCRTIVEYLAQELFIEYAQIDGEYEAIIKLAENLDFRKIVNEFLYNKDETKTIISKDNKEKFNNIYTMGNDWVHPKTSKQTNVEDTAKNIILLLRDLLDSLRNVFNDYYANDGKLIPKLNRKLPRRPMKLTE